MDAGSLFSPSTHGSSTGLPVTANADVVGPVGGFGWILKLDQGAPREIEFDKIEVESTTPMTISIAYPPGTTFTVTAHAAWCWSGNNNEWLCEKQFTQVGSIDEVRNGMGDTYHVSNVIR